EISDARCVFFFQAEDGIRDFHVTGVQTCALPIYEAHLNLSALYIQLQRYEESIAHTRRLLEDPTFPQPWRALTNLGWAELQLGQARAAAEHLQLALDHRDDYWPARLNPGILDASRGRPAAAIAR